MSLENYEKAVNIMKNNSHKFNCGRNISEDLIKKAQDALGIEFPKIYKKFLLQYGSISYGAFYIFGVIDDDFVNSSSPDAIWYTLTEREEINLPHNLLIIYDEGLDGEVFCMDFNNLNENNEPAIIAYMLGEEEEYQTYEKIADDFGDLLLQLVEEEESYED